MFQQAYWPELLELEYPEELQSQWDPLAPLSDELWEENQVDYLLDLPTCLEEMPEEFRLELHRLRQWWWQRRSPWRRGKSTPNTSN